MPEMETIKGIEAITMHNGWAMAVTGAMIVITGLSVLSFIISKLHKVIAFLENKQKKTTEEPATKNSQPTLAEIFSDDPGETARNCQILTTELGNSFELCSLFSIFHRHNLPHPHITIRNLRSAGFLVPQKDGKFHWKSL
ncbi:MAG: OadG family protein [Desulfobacteraceae bacterium]|nr:OadG family protein [Desulfobacteraceae bacterium]